MAYLVCLPMVSSQTACAGRALISHLCEFLTCREKHKPAEPLHPPEISSLHRRLCVLQDVEFAPEVRVAARLWLAEVADAAGAARLLACALAQPGLAELHLDGVLPSDLGPELVCRLHESIRLGIQGLVLALRSSSRA